MPRLWGAAYGEGMSDEQLLAKLAELREVVLDLCSDGPYMMKGTLESLRKTRRLARELEYEIMQRVVDKQA